MPLRGSLFRKLHKTKQQRIKAESAKIKREAIKESKHLKILRKQRIQSEGKNLLEKQITDEKRRIKAARGPSKAGEIEKFLAKGARASGRVVKRKVKTFKVKRTKIRFTIGG